MTRLASEDVKSIPAELANYDSELTATTGCSLKGVACLAAGAGAWALLAVTLLLCLLATTTNTLLTAKERDQIRTQFLSMTAR